MTDDRELAGLDPFALLDTEAGRLDAFLSGLSDSGWNRASRCAGWTAIHVAAELATHADDIAVPVTPDERADRTAWRARYSRFALAEAKPQLEIRQAGARTTVTGGPAAAELDDDELIEAVMGRLDETSGFSATLCALLSTMP